MKFLIIAVSCLVVGINAGVLTDLKSSLQSLGSGVQTTIDQIVPYSATVGKQLLKDSAKNLLNGLVKGLAATLTESISHLFKLGKRNVNVLHNLLAESVQLRSKIHQYEELLEHEFNNVVAGGDAKLAVERLHTMLEKVYDVVEKELAHLVHL